MVGKHQRGNQGYGDRQCRRQRHVRDGRPRPGPGRSATTADRAPAPERASAQRPAAGRATPPTCRPRPSRRSRPSSCRRRPPAATRSPRPRTRRALPRSVSGAALFIRVDRHRQRDAVEGEGQERDRDRHSRRAAWRRTPPAARRATPPCRSAGHTAARSTAAEQPLPSAPIMRSPCRPTGTPRPAGRAAPRHRAPAPRAPARFGRAPHAAAPARRRAAASWPAR